MTASTAMEGGTGTSFTRLCEFINSYSIQTDKAVQDKMVENIALRLNNYKLKQTVRFSIASVSLFYSALEHVQFSVL